jgi:hypothetical protein
VIDVRFTPDATKLLRSSEMTRCARTGHRVIGWTALKNGDMELTMASGAVFHLGATALTRISWIAAILAIATHRAVNKLQFQISRQETE